jgi:phage terminase large subunit
MFQRTTAVDKILQLNKFVRGVQGGTSAGKTYSILPILISIAAKTPLTDISVVAESIPHLKRGCIKDFKKIMVDTGRWVDARWNASDFKYNFANGSMIEFFSADADAKLRGARRDWLYMNECNNITFHSYMELASRTKQGIYLDWNPTNEFWFHEELMGDENVDFIIINYLDNEACPDSARDFILQAQKKAPTSNFWDNWYKVYGLGLVGSLQGTIFEFTQCDQIPPTAALLGYGLDFGYSNDPAAMVALYKQDNELYIEELIYSTKLTNNLIAERLESLNIDKQYYIVCDSAEPKSIAELKQLGWNNCIGTLKGADSIRHSISLLQEYKLNVLSTSLNLIKELRNYKWATAGDGKSTGKPIDDYNHLLDGLRYIALKRLNKKSGIINLG